VSEYIGHFSLWGDFVVEDVTGLLGMQPSQVYRKGEVIEGASEPARVSTWDLYCPDDNRGSMADQISALVNMLWPKKDVLRQLASEFKAELNVASSCSDGNSVLSLNREMLRQLLELNLKLNCFFYTCDEGPHGD